MKILGDEKHMKHNKFFKGIGVLVIIAFAVGILSLSIKTQTVNANEMSTDLFSGHMTTTMVEHMNQLSQNDTQQMLTMMEQHHVNNAKQDCSHLNNESSEET